jgi:L-cysteine S-thiosulfotransferase
MMTQPTRQQLDTSPNAESVPLNASKTPMKRVFSGIALVVSALLLSACATDPTEADIAAASDRAIKEAFRERGQAKLDRLVQDDAMKSCSRAPDAEKLPKAVTDRVEKANLALVKPPPGGKYLGDWREGERIAQSGVGKQFTDNPANPAGGNCYACHQLGKTELSFGTIGPSLYNYGKARTVNGQVPPPILEYTWGKIWNPQAYNACSNMPRFGHNDILTAAQIQHLMALLFDPASPVNQ